jgi:microcompartment protein CcmL/EutN
MQVEYVESNVTAAVLRGVEVVQAGGELLSVSEIAGHYYIVAEVKDKTVEVVEEATEVVEKPAKRQSKSKTL